MRHVSTDETEGVGTIARSSCLPTAVNMRTAHGLGPLRPCPGMQLQVRAPIGIVWREMDTQRNVP